LFVVIGGVAGAIYGDVLSDPHFAPQRVASSGNSFLDALTRWDGQWYLKIACEGYSYDPGRQSPVAFFPAYPTLIWIINDAFGVPTHLAAIILSHGFLIAALVVLARYVQDHQSIERSANVVSVLLVCVLFPTGCFWRMAYGDSLFLFLSVVSLHAIQRCWSPTAVALIVGLATASRPQAIALLVPFAIYVWSREGSVRRAVAQFAVALPLACWGLLAYMVFLFCAFGTPLAFAHTQAYWTRGPPISCAEKTLVLASAEPIWTVYNPSSLSYWRRFAPDESALISLEFANSIFFVSAVFLLTTGWYYRWLTVQEITFSIGVLAIPYATRSYEMCMGSHGRFVAAAFPLYLVLGRVLSGFPRPLAALVLAVSGFYLGAYSAAFAAGRMVI
jgi:hypothetical protein